MHCVLSVYIVQVCGYTIYLQETIEYCTYIWPYNSWHTNPPSSVKQVRYDQIQQNIEQYSTLSGPRRLRINLCCSLPYNRMNTIMFHHKEKAYRYLQIFNKFEIKTQILQVQATVLKIKELVLPLNLRSDMINQLPHLMVVLTLNKTISNHKACHLLLMSHIYTT